MATADQIIRILDVAAENCSFPILDNGYNYLAATRASLHRSSEDWALVLEVFDFSPRGFLPALLVFTIGSRLRDRNRAEDYVSLAAYQGYLANHPHDESRFFHPIAEGAWQDEECLAMVARGARELLLRDRPVTIPDSDDFATAGIALCERPRIHVFEVCRFLAARHRDDVLATRQERGVSVPKGLAEILVLDEWHHPDLSSGELPSQCESFVQLAEVLASGEVARYAPSAPPNTHWTNWPDGGTL